MIRPGRLGQRLKDVNALEREHPWRGGDEGKGGRRGRGDATTNGVGGRGTTSSVLGGALSSLVELQERMDGITSSFATKASDVNALVRTWR